MAEIVALMAAARAIEQSPLLSAMKIEGQPRSVCHASLDSKVVLGVSFPGEGKSPRFPLIRLAGAGLCSPFFNFRFGLAETGSIFYGDRFSRRPSACRV
jgi:hypothetical protein